MSASLVGSEMCIRDSASSCALGPLVAARSGTTPAPASPTTAPERNGAPPCLLYTSDAADDM
eukprot:1618463-Alexandrium_andersonii.AAC.1